MKGPDDRSLQTKEENMSTFTTSAELARLTDRELDIMFRSVMERLSGCAEGAPERREALATLALIRREMTVRQSRRPKPGF